MKQVYVLAHETARQRAIAALQGAADGQVVTISDPVRSKSQSAHLHAALTEYGNSIKWKWQGYYIDLDDLKSIMVAAFRKSQGVPSRMLPGVDGEPVLLGWRTRDLSRKECAQLIDQVYGILESAKTP